MREIERIQMLLSKNAESELVEESEISLHERDGQKLKSKGYEA